MFYNNPFGSWNEAGQGSSSQSPFGTNPPPSIFGALPYPSSGSDLVTFYFTAFNPNIMNCNVVNSQSQVYYRVVTDNQMPGYTVIKNQEGKNVSLIEWQAHPLIEIRGLLAKQYVQSWLGLNQDKSARIMTIRGIQYTWTPREKSIMLYARTHEGPKLLAKVTRANGTICLEIIPEAIQLGLLDGIVAAALLLQCGRNID